MLYRGYMFLVKNAVPWIYVFSRTNCWNILWKRIERKKHIKKKLELTK